MTSFSAIVLDFDLTLADSRQGFIACHNFAAAHFELNPPSPEDVEASIGTPLPIVFERFYGTEKAALTDDYIRVYQVKADEVMTDLTVMLPGSADAVRRLRDSGLRLGIVSQKLRYRVEEVLQRESLLDDFDIVLGGDDIPAFKPDPRGLTMAVEALHAPGSAIFVGDTTIDAETARRAGLPFVAVLTGPTTAQEFESFAPLARLPSVASLPDWIEAEAAKS